MSCLIPQTLYGIIGWPLGHSLSPLLHNTGFRTLDIPAAYMAWPLEPKSLPVFMDALRVMRVGGCSVTIPHKISVLEYMENLSEGAALAGAANTLFWKDNLLCGENTDITGFLTPLKNFEMDKMDVLLLGAGGAAHAVAAALRLRGCRHVRVASAGNKKQYAMAERFGFEGLPWAERHNFPATLVINATPLGMSGQYAGETPYDFGLAPKVEGGLAYDLVYNPPETIFLKDAKKFGRQTISGVEMFFWQGNAQFRLWTGKNLPQESRRALESALKQ